MLLGTADPCYYSAMFKDTGKRIENLWLLYFAADLFALAASYYGVLLLRFHSIGGQKLFLQLSQMEISNGNMSSKVISGILFWMKETR